MKQKLQKQKGRLMSSLLPQKWLMSLLTLLLFCIGGGSAWADTYEFVSGGTHVDGSSTFDFDGKTIGITNDGSKKGGAVTIGNFQGLKYQAGVTFTITFPNNEIVKQIVFEGMTRDGSKTSYISHINNVERTDNNNVPGTTQFPNNTSSVTGKYTVDFYSTKTNTVSFKVTGTESVLRIKVTTEDANAAKFTITWDTKDLKGADAWFTLNDASEQYRETKTDVAAGTKVVLHAKDIETNGQYMFFNRWFDGNNTSYGWGNRNYTFTDNLQSNITVGPEFQAGRKYVGATQGKGGVVKVHTWNNETNDFNNDDINGKKELWANHVQFEAIASDGYGFVKWNENNNTDSKLELTDQPTGSDITYTAVFERTGPKVTWTVSNKTYNAGDELSTNLDVVSIKLNDGTWVYDTGRKGITTRVQGTDTEMGTCLVIRPKVDIELELSTYASQSNCNLVMCEDWNVLKDFREKGYHTNDFGKLSAGHTYYVFGKSFKAQGTNEYIFFTGFTVAYPGFAHVGKTDFTDVFGGAYSEYREITPHREYICEFVNHGDGAEVWNNFNLVVTADNPAEHKDASHIVTLRADNFVLGSTLVGGNKVNPSSVQLKGGGVIDWDTYIADLDGAYVKSRTSFSGEHISVYNEITNNGRTYIQTYVSGKFAAKDKVYVSYTIDHSYIDIVYQESWQDVRCIWLDGGMQNGTATLELVNGTKVPNGFMAELNSEIVAIPVPNANYLFKQWGGSGEKDNPRKYLMNADVTVYADFLASVDWSLRTDVQNGTLYFSDGTAWDRNTHYSSAPLPNGMFDGAYTSVSGDGKTELYTVAGLRFNNNVRLKYRTNDGEILLYAPGGTKSGGAVRIPVQRGEIVRITASGAKDMELPYVNSDGASSVLDITTVDTEYDIIAQADGYIEVFNTSGNFAYIRRIKKDWKADFEFEDGEVVYAYGGAKDYVNDPVNILALSSDKSFRWYSSNAGDVPVTEYTGRVNPREGFVGDVKITATMVTSLYPYVAKSYTLKVVNQNLTSHNETVTLEENGTYSGECQIPGNLPSGAKVTYSIVSTTAKDGASVTNNGTAWVVSIFGKDKDNNPSITKVRITCGALSTEYEITADGFVFAKTNDIYRFNGDYPLQITGATNYTCETYGNITGAYVDGGRIKGLPASQGDNGGTIVVKASDDHGHNATFVLTVPYLHHVWNFYKEGQITGGNVNNRLSTGDLVNSTNPGSAFLVSCLQENSTDSIDISSLQLQPLKKKPGEILSFKTDLRKWTNWRNHQNGNLADTDPHKYWNYTFKTFSHVKGNPRILTYTNEPLFSYKKAIDGDNVRVVKNTEGLVFNCGADCFGINDNPYGTIHLDDRDNDQDTREKDRAVIIKGTDSKLIIPGVKAGYYVKLHWYRHSDDAGDQFTVTNAIDLDGRPIDPYDVLRFTGSHYTHHNFEGSTIFQAAADGDVEIKIANNNWTEIYRIEVMEDYNTDQRLCQVNAYGEGNNRSVGTGMQNERDLNNPAHYNWENDGNSETVDGPRITAYLTSKIQTYAKGGQLIEPAKDFYISAYAGQAYTWNGWLNTKVSVDKFGSANCQTESYEQQGVTYNTLPIDNLWVGNRLRYQMHHVTNVSGTGTFKFTFRTITGWKDEPHYTLNKQEVHVAVGEYSVQEYPYTWDFTDYNTGLQNAYGQYSFYTLYGNKDNTQDYGGWTSYANGQWSMHAYKQDYSSVIARDANTTHTLNGQNRNKPLFAQGAQLAIGQNAKHTLLETEGLRMYIPEVTTANDGAIKFQAGKVNDPVYDNAGYLSVKAGCKIVIPEVDKNMYVFVAGTVAPSAATNTKTSDTQFAQNVTKKNSEAIVTYYQATGAADGGKADIELSFAQDATIYKIGVTNEKKTIAYFGYSTESRARNIDYNETRYFSADVEQNYVNLTDGWKDKNNNFTFENMDNDLEVRVSAQTFPVKDRAYTPHGTGIIMHDLDVQYDAADEDHNASNKPIVPLFVAACNVPQTNDNLNDNKLVASTDIDREYTEIWTSKEGSDDQYYTMSNHYIGAKLENNFWKTGKIYTTVPRFYRYIGSGASSSDAGFVKTSANMYNMAFLYFPSAADVKGLGDIISVDFGDGIGAEPTGIEIVGYGVNPIGNGIYYNLRGQALNGKPSVPGVYIKDGKKYYVK